MSLFPLPCWIYSHHSEAEPLHTYLCNAQQASSTLECANSLAACDICPRCRKDQYIGESACSGCCAEENEVWGDALTGSSSYNSIMLWEIRYEDSKENEARLMSVLFTNRAPGYLHGQREVEVAGGLKLLAATAR